jgi:hypothetical protein
MARRTIRQKRSETASKGYSIRMGQLLGPYSVGAIYPCDANNIVMIAGLDAFDTEKMDEVSDGRLCKHLGVERLLAPPKHTKKDSGFVPAVRFPGWMYCPKCKRMEYISTTNTSSSITCSNPACREKNKWGPRLVPERFIVVCPDGHIDDFPVMQWLHKGASISPKDPNHIVTRTTTGGSATMGDIVYRCSCGAWRTLQGATTANGLNSIGYHCPGRRPWLDLPGKGCNCPVENLRVSIMGATNVCYADTVSSVLIPDLLDERVKNIVANEADTMAKMEAAGVLASFIQSLGSREKADPSAIALAYEKLKETGDAEQTDDEYLYDEYLTLRDPSITKRGEFVGEAVDILYYRSQLMQEFFSRVSLIDTLTVTRALVGFSRLNPEANDGKKMKERRSALSRKPLGWTLAVQTVGEGIFLELDEDALGEWLARETVSMRFSEMQRNLDISRRSRNQAPKKLNPKYVVLHTLAHLLILGISQVCGYSAASLRERVYCEKFLNDGIETHADMHGILIYTASESGDGSLGGLVRSGRPGRLEGILRKALEDALWCSGDPVCIESHGQGLDSCNLAACYNCALLPETSCETGNRFLDRGLLIGTIDEPSTGLLGADLRLGEIS